MLPKYRPAGARISRLAGGASGSLVLSVTLKGQTPKQRFVPGVVKISNLEWVQEEEEKFRTYAQWWLPHNRRTELFGKGVSGHLGAIGYSFAFGGGDLLGGFDEILKTGDTDGAKAIISSIFNDDTILFYQTHTEPSSDFICDRYSKRYFQGSRFDETKSLFNTLAARLMAANVGPTEISVAGMVFPEPFRFLFENFRVAYSQTFVHGDLHAKNVLINNRGEVAFIDFEDTGIGHVFEDFAALETSIRLAMPMVTPPGKTPTGSSFLKRELTLVGHTTSKRTPDGRSQLILKLRDLARSRFDKVEPWEYLYSIAALHLRLLRIRGLTDIQLKLLIACVLATCRKLEECLADIEASKRH